MTTLAEQIATLESRLADYESRKVPLSAGSLWCIYNDHDGGTDTSILAVASAALVAAESPDAVKAALKAWSNNTSNYGTTNDGVLAAIRAAHDAAIGGGCGAARESDEVQERPRIIHEDIRRRFDAEVEHHKLTVADRDKWLAEAKRLEKEHDDLKEERDQWMANANAHRGNAERELKCNHELRLQLDALTRPIDGVKELGRIGWEAWQLAIDCPPRPHATERNVTADSASAQAIASRVIGALRSAFVHIESDAVDTLNPTSIFDAAVASLKIEPAKVEQTSPVDSRPVVKVGQVLEKNGDTFKVAAIDLDNRLAYDANGMALCLTEGRPVGPWSLISDAPTSTPKREPFELRKEHIATPNEIALRDKVREIERRLEAGGL